MQLLSTRKLDSIQEKIINQFLLNNYFSKLNQTAKLNYDAELQKLGVDLQTQNKNGNIVNFDIKAQASPKYINMPTSTFILELSSLTKYKEPYIGWFLNKELITDYYVFAWIHSAKVNAQGYIDSEADIEKVEVMVVHRQSLYDYIMSLTNSKSLEDVAASMRENNITRCELVKGIHFSHSAHLFEKPVCLVVKKHILKKFTLGKAYHCMVTPTKITPLSRCYSPSN